MRAGRWTERNACYHLIANVKNKRPQLHGEFAEFLCEQLLRLPELCNFHLLAFVVMPEHVHVIGQMEGTLTVSEVMGRWKRFTGRELNRRLDRRGAFWQAGFYDHRIRSETELAELVEYVHLNPVTNELVARPVQWRYSSLRLTYLERLTGWERLGYSRPCWSGL